MKWFVIILALLALGLGLWFAPKFLSRARFAGFPGTYACEDFGLPDAAHPTIRIDESFNLYGVGEKEVLVGRLQALDGSKSRARLELSGELVHSADFALDPFDEHRVEGVGGSVVLSATRDGKLLYSHPCYRK